MTTLFQRARRRFDPLNGPWPDASDMAYVSYARPASGLEEQYCADFEGAARLFRGNGPVFALMNKRMSVFSEARFQFRQMRNGRPGDLFGTPDLALLEQPWPNGTTGDLLSRTIQDADIGGNFFATEVNGHVKRLRPDWVTIVTGSMEDPDLYGDALDGELLGYIYNPRGGLSTDDAVVLLPEQVAHFAPIPDPLFNFRGMSWLTPVLREVAADDAARDHKYAFFKNGATPQVIVSLDASITEDQFKKFVSTMDATHKGVANAYKTLYLGGGADVTVAGKDLQQLDFKATQGAGETRLAAAAGIHPVLVGFSEGLAGSSLNAGNYAMARRSTADTTFRPLWRNVAGSLARLVNVPAASELWYDERDIAFLREDAKDSAEIFGLQIRAVRQGTDAGFDPDATIDACAALDITRLKGTHSGLFSVQLQPPGPGTTPDAGTQTDETGAAP